MELEQNISAEVPERLFLLGAKSNAKEVSSNKPIADLQSGISHDTVPSLPEESYYGNTKYPGDIIDTSPLIEPKTLPFATSVQLLASFNDAIASQREFIYAWQKDVSTELCLPDFKPTAQHPLKYCLVANNGSGKDSFIIAPFALWFIITKMLSRVIITTSSGVQMSSQTEQYIRLLAGRINETMGVEVFRIRQRYIKCRWTGSEIRMFVTDEAGKAEGYHPIEPGAEMCIIVNEGKSILPEIYTALRRCTGYNYWLEISSPGEPNGDFYQSFTDERLKYKTKRITSFDCPNISEEEREADKIRYGEHSAYYRSKHLALFTSLGGEVIIPIELVNRLLENPPQLKFTSAKLSVYRIGGDLSAGGDELSLCMTKGNRQIKEAQTREVDTTLGAQWIDKTLKLWEIPKNHEYIFMDDGGVGHAIIDMLVRMGWNIKRIHNQSPAIYKAHYGNRGAQAWDIAKRLFEENVWNPIGMSKICIEQLTQRKVKDKLVGAKMYLQSKKEAKAHGFKSPDRADAFILSLTGLTLDDFLRDGIAVSALSGEHPVTVSQDALEEHYENNLTYADYSKLTNTSKRSSGKRVNNSLRSAIESGNYDN